MDRISFHPQMNKNKVLILGSGHLAYRVEKLARERGYNTIHFSTEKFQLNDPSTSSFDFITSALKDIDPSLLVRAFIIDDRDDYNLQLMIVVMSLYEQLPITASLFNENMAPHLRAMHPKLEILNPAKIAGPVFVESLYKPVERHLRYMPDKPPKEFNAPSDSLIKRLVITFFLLMLAATSYFHFFENLSWLDAFYFVVVTVATVGYGDINLVNAAPVSKIIGILLILSSTVFIWMIFSLTIDRIIKNRIEVSLGRKKYSYKDHIVICGLGKLGFFIAEDLLKKGEKIVIVEENVNSQNVHYFRQYGVEIYIGNARLPRVLQDVGVANAKALISVVSDDYLNLEIGMNARSFQPGLRLILRFFDDSMAKRIKDKLDIHISLSMSAIADEKFIQCLDSITTGTATDRTGATT